MPLFGSVYLSSVYTYLITYKHVCKPKVATSTPHLVMLVVLKVRVLVVYISNTLQCA